MSVAFLDTNILLRHLLGDHPDQSPRATSLIARIEQDELTVRTTDTVIFETVLILERHYRQPKHSIRQVMLALLGLSNIILPGKRRYRNIFDLYVDLNLPFADAYHAALMHSLHIEEFYSLDRDFDRIEGIQRREP